MPLELSVDELAPYVGRYELRMDTVELRLEDSGLVAQVFSKGGFPTADSPPHPPSPATRLAFFDRDRLIALDPPFTGGRAEFLRDQDGRIAWLRWGSRLAAPAQ